MESCGIRGAQCPHWAKQTEAVEHAVRPRRVSYVQRGQAIHGLEHTTESSQYVEGSQGSRRALSSQYSQWLNEPLPQVQDHGRSHIVEQAAN